MSAEPEIIVVHVELFPLPNYLDFCLNIYCSLLKHILFHRMTFTHDKTLKVTYLLSLKSFFRLFQKKNDRNLKSLVTFFPTLLTFSKRCYNPNTYLVDVKL